MSSDWIGGTRHTKIMLIELKYLEWISNSQLLVMATFLAVYGAVLPVYANEHSLRFYIAVPRLIQWHCWTCGYLRRRKSSHVSTIKTHICRSTVKIWSARTQHPRLKLHMMGKHMTGRHNIRINKMFTKMQTSKSTKATACKWQPL